MELSFLAPFPVECQRPDKAQNPQNTLSTQLTPHRALHSGLGTATGKISIFQKQQQRPERVCNRVHNLHLDPRTVCLAIKCQASWKETQPQIPEPTATVEPNTGTDMAMKVNNGCPGSTFLNPHPTPAPAKYSRGVFPNKNEYRIV